MMYKNENNGVPIDRIIATYANGISLFLALLIMAVRSALLTKII
ncbi:hypothetical protein GCM10009576_099660 [Streptomyces rhizosphaericus]|uniref:Uncharacterized protein n=1 Tax=Streptomyces rhizosphaericus TaxID=114699 RepID=A0ABN1TFF6_9ACTN